MNGLGKFFLLIGTLAGLWSALSFWEAGASDPSAYYLAWTAICFAGFGYFLMKAGADAVREEIRSAMHEDEQLRDSIPDAIFVITVHDKGKKHFVYRGGGSSNVFQDVIEPIALAVNLPLEKWRFDQTEESNPINSRSHLSVGQGGQCKASAISSCPDQLYDFIRSVAFHLETKNSDLSALIDAHHEELERIAFDLGRTEEPLDEGFSEFFCYYMLTPDGDYARRSAPIFFSAFELWLEIQPRLLEARLWAAREAYIDLDSSPHSVTDVVVSYGDKAIDLKKITEVTCVNREVSINFVTSVERYISVSDGTTTMKIDVSKTGSANYSRLMYERIYEVFHNRIFRSMAFQIKRRLMQGEAVEIERLGLARHAVLFPPVMRWIGKKRPIPWHHVTWEISDGILIVGSTIDDRLDHQIKMTAKNAHVLPRLFDLLRT